MSKLYFRNTKNWKNVYADLFSKSGSTIKTSALTEKDSVGDFVLDFDSTEFESVRFCGTDTCGKLQQTNSVFPGTLSFGIEHKYNENKESDLTYLFCKQDKVTGHVDTYVLKDEVNLSYRENADKKINVFVPSSYDGSTPHEILYFFDAQNLFADAGRYTDDGDPYGSWQLDIALNALHHRYGKNTIVVAIDNADELRMSELFMDPKSFGKPSLLATDVAEEEITGHLDELYAFMTETVHPFVKANYCTTETCMGIGGSSMGGIAAFYCALKKLGTFSYCLSYSPAFGLYEMDAFENFFAKSVFAKSADKLPKIHIYCGEGDELEKLLVTAAKDMKTILAKHGYPAQLIAETYDPAKVHNEEAWRLILGESFSFFHKV